MTTATTARKPAGPLTAAERNAVVLDMLAAYPHPVALLASKLPGVVRRARAMGVEWEEIDAACRLGVMRAARVFDPARGFVLSTIALHYMRAEVGELTRRDTRDRERRGGASLLSLDYVPAGDDGPADQFLEAPDVTTEAVDANDEAARVRRAVAELPDRLRRVVGWRWGLATGAAETLRQVADRLRLSKERVRQLEAEALGRLKAILTGEGDRRG